MSDRLTEIAARAAAATPGPWSVERDEPTLSRLVCNENRTLEIDFGYVGNRTQDDAEFVAHAREDVPWLLAEVEQLRAEREKYVGKEPTVAEEMQHLNRCLNAVYDLCEEAKRAAGRWENPLPIPEWVAAVEHAADGNRPTCRPSRAEVLREAADAIEADDRCTRPYHREHYANLLRGMASAAGGESTRDGADTCGRCRRPFDPADTQFDGRGRYRDTPFCGGCVDRCHESTDAFHRCPVCTEGGADRG